MDDAAGGLIIAVVWGCFGCISIAGFVFWIYAIIDVVKRTFPGENDKLIWTLVVILAGWLGALIYWFVGRDKGTLPP